MYGIVKCLPTSRRKSSSWISPSQSRLLTIADRREIEEPLELAAHRGHVRGQGFAIEQVALARPARRIADHPRPATDHGNRAAAVPLQLDEPEDRDEVADMEPRPRRIEADIAGDRPPRGEARLEALRGVVEHAAPA